ncbi:MAG TPA: hypothetical protein VHV77_07395 [Pirellulales bacterium]|jgi:hypothetical protein|nr:hypothetical protein [Pirellulales bacterium]
MPLDSNTARIIDNAANRLGELTAIAEERLAGAYADAAISAVDAIAAIDDTTDGATIATRLTNAADNIELMLRLAGTRITEAQRKQWQYDSDECRAWTP